MPEPTVRVTFPRFETIYELQARGLRIGKTVGSHWDPVETASRAKKYDPEAFAVLFDEFFEKIRRFAYFHTGDPHLADDLAAEVFSQALESIASFKDRGGTIGPWLFGIARNVVASHFRASGAKQTVQLDEGIRSPEAEGPEQRALENLSCEEGPEQRALENLSCEELYEALATLPEDQRAIVILRFIEGYDVKTVASIVNKRPGAVRTSQHRAIAALRKRFEDIGRNDEGGEIEASTG